MCGWTCIYGMYRNPAPALLINTITPFDEYKQLDCQIINSWALTKNYVLAPMYVFNNLNLALFRGGEALLPNYPDMWGKINFTTSLSTTTNNNYSSISEDDTTSTKHRSLNMLKVESGKCHSAKVQQMSFNMLKNRQRSLI